VDNSATLTGSVDLYEYKAEAEKRVSKIKGVTDVRNLIEVAGPLSQMNNSNRNLPRNWPMIARGMATF
jgi:hypothetical protein